MDNKRWSKRFSTLFWWTLTILPLIIALIYFIGYHLTFNSGISTAQELADYHANENGDFLTFLGDILYTNDISFNNFIVPALFSAFRSLFARLGLGVAFNYNVLGALFGWMASVQMYHLLFDFFAWLPRLIHTWMDRWCVE